MGFGFAQMIFPDTDSSDISLREYSAVLADLVDIKQLFYTSRFKDFTKSKYSQSSH